MIFSHISEQCPHNWETTMRPNVVLTIFHTQNICHLAWKTVRTTLWCLVVHIVPELSEGTWLSSLNVMHFFVSNCGEKVMKRRKTMGQICPIVFRDFLTLTPGLENNKTSKCGSESFPRMVTYILCVENGQNYISMHSCLPIAERLF